MDRQLRAGEFPMANWTDDAGLFEELKKRVSAFPEGSDMYDLILDLRTGTYTQEKLLVEKIDKSAKISSKGVYATELKKILKDIARQIEETTEASNNTVEETSSSAMKAGASQVAIQKRRARDESEQDEDGVASNNTNTQLISRTIVDKNTLSNYHNRKNHNIIVYQVLLC